MSDHQPQELHQTKPSACVYHQIKMCDMWVAGRLTLQQQLIESDEVVEIELSWIV